MTAPLPFQQFQFAFGRHLRDPQGRHRPTGLPARRTGIYRELVRNNLEGFLLACFPVCRTLLGERRWTKLVAAFFRDARCQTPYFREIPREFLHWLLNAERLPVRLPAWLPELAHYEWAELAVDVMDAGELPQIDVDGDLLDGMPVLVPALMNLAYAWPVHKIGTRWRPRKPLATQLLVYRDTSDTVRFMLLNPVSARLISVLQTGCTGRTACLAIAAELAHPDPGAVLGHGVQLLMELRTAGVILGSKS